MISTSGRKPASIVIEPIARVLLAIGATPNMITVGGALLTIVASCAFIATGHLIIGAVISAFFALTDMIDGTMARMRGGGTTFGATLDATCDRLTDGALFAAMTWWLLYKGAGSHLSIVASLSVIVSSQVISYVKARAEASGIPVHGGLIERPERLILGLGGVFLQGLGVPHAIEVAVVLLACGSLFTIIQRLYAVSRDPHALAGIAAPEGAKTFDNTHIPGNSDDREATEGASSGSYARSLSDVSDSDTISTTARPVETSSLFAVFPSFSSRSSAKTRTHALDDSRTPIFGQRMLRRSRLTRPHRTPRVPRTPRTPRASRKTR